MNFYTLPNLISKKFDERIYVNASDSSTKSTHENERQSEKNFCPIFRKKKKGVANDFVVILLDYK